MNTACIVKIACSVCLLPLIGACATHTVRCDGTLRPINAPAPARVTAAASVLAPALNPVRAATTSAELARKESAAAGQGARP